MPEVVVIGAGVIGLTSAVALLQRGHKVRVLAQDFAWRTTSAVAAAIWFPYEAHPPARVHRWAKVTYDVFAQLAQTKGTGVVMTEGVVHARASTPSPWWRALAPAHRPAAGALPAGVLTADVFTVPVAEMPIYLQYLVGEIQRLGGCIEQHTLAALTDVDAPCIVHCAGLGARALARDDEVFPIRGQVVCTERAVDHFVIDDDHPAGVTYIIPRSNDCVLGGTAQHGADDLAADAAQTAAIRARCAELRPALAGAAVREVKVGLRPGRTSVRLQAEPTAGGRRVIHNYGHGGAGMTLSWGCAFEAAELVERDG
jgi:D-amino-acid oxidase